MGQGRDGTGAWAAGQDIWPGEHGPENEPEVWTWTGPGHAPDPEPGHGRVGAEA